ncbi:MAG: Uma2 family endonuclease [Bryobacterales bacterium]|nr:Uma2 family endonuclease [Bryobacterales bacterium]
MYTYPDLTVICRPVETVPGRKRVVTNPVFVAEVLSPATGGIDRGAKLREYRASPSVQQYGLVSLEEAWVEIHRCDETGFWRITEVTGLTGVCVLSAIGCSVSMAAIYEGVLEG